MTPKININAVALLAANMPLYIGVVHLKRSKLTRLSPFQEHPYAETLFVKADINIANIILRSLEILFITENHTRTLH